MIDLYSRVSRRTAAAATIGPQGHIRKQGVLTATKSVEFGDYSGQVAAKCAKLKGESTLPCISAVLWVKMTMMGLELMQEVEEGREDRDTFHVQM